MDIERRLAELERTARRARRTAAVAVLALLVLTTAAWTHSGKHLDAITTSRIVLVDEDGVPRGEWSCNGRREPMLKMQDSEGTDRLRIGINKDGAVAVFHDTEGRVRLAHSVDSAGHPHGLWLDHRRQVRVHVSVGGEDGYGNIQLTDLENHTPVGMGFMPDGSPWLRPSNDFAGGEWGLPVERPADGAETTAAESGVRR